MVGRPPPCKSLASMVNEVVIQHGSLSKTIEFFFPSKPINLPYSFGDFEEAKWGYG